MYPEALSAGVPHFAHQDSGPPQDSAPSQGAVMPSSSPTLLAVRPALGDIYKWQALGPASSPAKGGGILHRSGAGHNSRAKTTDLRSIWCWHAPVLFLPRRASARACWLPGSSTAQGACATQRLE